ncbi:uncharacterized protein LOC135840508 [Planococcus citri]|uniref:uncharacterized protein LOC135840508 n=1 Tax=Planococcus citri TaxID=170843 RepID=UPI0031F8F224
MHRRRKLFFIVFVEKLFVSLAAYFFFTHVLVMCSRVQFLFQLTVGIFLTRCSEGLIFSPPPGISSTEHPPPPIPQYRFHYHVRDENTGDYKSQEEHRSGDSVTGSYMVAEPNGDLRVVKYVADVANGFKADVNVQPGGSPMKPSTIGVKKATEVFNNQRTGISAPAKQRKPTRGFNPIIVKSLSPFSQPPPQLSSKTEPSSPVTPSQSSYSYYRENTDTTRNISVEFTTPVITQKSVQVELTYRDDSVVEKPSEKVALPEKKITPILSTESTSTLANKNFNLQSLAYLSTELPVSKTPITEIPTSRITAASPPSTNSNGLYHLDNSDISSSIIEILNQQKSDYKYPPVNAPTYVSESSSRIPSSVPVTESTPYTRAASEQTSDIANPNLEFDPYKKANLPQRPMRLIGLSPIYMDHAQLQALSENLTSPPQIPALDHIINMQYATPTPLVSGPLMGGPGPFRNIPRYASEFNDLSQLQPNSNLIPNPNSVPSNLPAVNSIPISAPIIPQADTKQENKPVPPPPLAAASIPLCNDCFLPANLANYMSYPLLKFPAQAASASASTTNNNQKPCVTENTPYNMAPYKPAFAYILFPSLPSSVMQARH